MAPITTAGRGSRSSVSASRSDSRCVTPYLDVSVEEFGMERIPAWFDSRSTARTVEQRTISETADEFFRTFRRELTGP